MAKTKTKIKIQSKISSLEDIIEFINKLTTEYVALNTEFNRRVSNLKSRIYDDELSKEFEKYVSETKIFKASRNLFPLKLKLVGITGSDVRLRLVECINTIQKMEDKAMEEKKLTGTKKYEIGTLKGAIKEFMYMVDTLDDELVILSKDDTHLRKTAMAVFINASKLMSLEAKLYGQTDRQSFDEVLGKLPKESQRKIIEDYLLEEFQPEWLPYFSEKTLQKCLDQLLNNPEINSVSTRPATLLDLFQQFTTNKREKFLVLLSNVLNGKELNTLRNITSQNKQ